MWETFYEGILEISLYIMICIFIYYICMLLRMWLKKPERNLERKKLMIILGSGGHTTEINYMLERLKLVKYKRVYFLLATSDTNSKQKTIKYLMSMDTNLGDMLKNVVWVDIRRSREVHQSYFTAIFTTFIAFIQSLIIIIRFSPHLVVSNGPGTAFPICLSQKLSKYLLINWQARLLFIESICRVTNLSLTGKLLYPICDKLLVHWPELVSKYKRTTYIPHMLY